MIQINDPGETLSATQVQTLTAKAAAYPFDLHVLIAGDLPRGVFNQAVDAYVTPGSRVLAIGIDPVHHFAHVHASGALGVPAGPAVAAAGTPFFKAGNLVDCIDAIAAKANELRVDTRIVTSQTGMPIVIHEHHTAPGVWAAAGVFAALALCAAVCWLWRARKLKQRETEAAMEAAELRARNLEEADWHDEMADRRSRRVSTSAQVDPGVKPTFDEIEHRAEQARRAMAAPSGANPGQRTPPGYYEQMVEVSRRNIPPSYAPTPAPVVVVNQDTSVLDAVVDYEILRDLERDRSPVVVEPYVAPEQPSSSSWTEPDTSSSFDFSTSNNDTSSDSSFDSSSSDTSSDSGFDSGSSDS